MPGTRYHRVPGLVRVTAVARILTRCPRTKEPIPTGLDSAMVVLESLTSQFPSFARFAVLRIIGWALPPGSTGRSDSWSIRNLQAGTSCAIAAQIEMHWDKAC